MTEPMCVDCECGKNYTIEGRTCGLCTDEQEMAHYIERASVVLGDCFEEQELKRFFVLLVKVPGAIEQLRKDTTEETMRNYAKMGLHFCSN